MDFFLVRNFGLLLTYGGSLDKWAKTGTINREIKIYNELSNYFNNLYIFSYGVNDNINYSSILNKNVIVIDKPKYMSNFIYSLILPIIHRKVFKNLNILKTNQMYGAWTMIIVKKLFKAKVVVRCGYEWLQYLKNIKANIFKRILAKMIERSVYKTSDKIIVTSQESLDFIIDEFDLDKSKIFLIPNYIDIDKFSILPVKKEKGRVIFVGRLDEVKNLSNLIIAMKDLNSNLVIVGDGPTRYRLESLAKANNVDVTFRGILDQDKLPIELNRSEIFVLPSISEGNPKALLEAMSSGLACIGTDIPSINEIIMNGINGIICDVDHNSIHNALKNLLLNDNLRSRLGMGAHKTVIDKYSFEKVFSQELKLYKMI